MQLSDLYYLLFPASKVAALGNCGEFLTAEIGRKEKVNGSNSRVSKGFKKRQVRESQPAEAKENKVERRGEEEKKRAKKGKR